MITATLRPLAVSLFMFIFSAVRALGFDIVEFTTPGGIEVRLVEDHELPLVAMEFVLQRGSIDEPAGKEGVMNFVTAMVDEGSGTYDGTTFRKLRDDNAVRLGLQVSADNTTGSLQMPTSQLDLGFDLMKSFVTAPQFPAEAVERVRKSLLVSAEAVANNPGELAFRQAGDLVLKGHPYNRPTRGTAQSLTAITRDDLVAAHNTVFTRQGLKVGISGDITREEAARRIDALLGALPMGEKRPPLPAVPAWPGAKLSLVPWEMPQSIILFGGPGLTYEDPDYFAAMVLMEVIGGGRSRLNTEVREKRGLTYGIGYGLYNFKEAGFTFGSMSTPNEKAAEAIKVVQDVLKDVREKGPSATEVEAAKNYIKGSYVFRFESISGMAGVVANNMAYGLPVDYHKRRNDIVSAVTLEQVNAVAKRLIDPANLVFVVAGKPVGLKEQ
jgi:zinc protease